jgi:PEGA domain
MKQCWSLQQNTFILLFVACLIIAGIPAAMAATETPTPPPLGCTIIVESYPVGAAVTLNGDYRGVTPIEFDNLTAGEYDVTVGLAGYDTETIPSMMFDGHTREIMVQLQNSSVPTQTPTPGPLSRYGSIAIDSTPGGASVTLDGIAAGQTPMTRAALILNSVPVGNHTVQVELAGYPPFTSTFTVIKGQVSRINAELSVSSQPVTATIPNSVAQAAPTQKSGVPPAIIIGAVGFIGIVAAFRRS